MKTIKQITITVIVGTLAINNSFSQWSEDANNIWNTTNNKLVGIGTTTPTAPLDINNNILLGLDYPAYGVRIKTNWPGYNGGWARGYFIVNENNTQNYFGLGVTGGATAGTTTMSYAWLGPDPDKAYMSFLPNGNIGIGTSTPQTKLHITNGNQSIKFLTGTNSSGYALSIGINDDGINFSNNSAIRGYNFSNASGTLLSINDNGNIGIGTTSPTEKLSVNGAIQILGGQPIYFLGDHNDPNYLIQSGDWKDGMKYKHWTSHQFFTNGNERFRISWNGNVGIGTTNPNEKLEVNGNIKAKKLIVTQTGWADYVFDKEYKLMKLNDLSTYIQKNKHLPEIPSTKQIEKEGVDVATNQALLLKKIEELTLYILQQDERIKKLENEKMNK